MNIDESVACCRALGDPTRMRLVRLLATSNDEACLCEFEASLEEPAYKLSRHLKILRDAGLLRGEKEGRWVYHRVAVDPEALMHLIGFVRAASDEEGIYARDYQRFVEIQKCRTGGRCRGADSRYEGDPQAQIPDLRARRARA